jgi:hypothetical protein
MNYFVTSHKKVFSGTETKKTKKQEENLEKRKGKGQENLRKKKGKDGENLRKRKGRRRKESLTSLF